MLLAMLTKLPEGAEGLEAEVSEVCGSRSVLLAALSILPYSAVDAARSEAEAELEKDRSMRVANLLGFSVVRACVHAYPYSDICKFFITSPAQCSARSCTA